MSIITIEHVHVHADGDEAVRLLHQLIKKVDHMAQSQSDIQAKLDTLETAVDAERAEVLAELEALKALIASGADLSAIGDRVDALTAKVQGIITDADK